MAKLTKGDIIARMDVVNADVTRHAWVRGAAGIGSAVLQSGNPDQALRQLWNIVEDPAFSNEVHVAAILDALSIALAYAPDLPAD